jgi:hypothetical protein
LQDPGSKEDRIGRNYLRHSCQRLKQIRRPKLVKNPWLMEAKAGEESLADGAHGKSLELEYERQHLHPWERSFSPVSRYRC